MNDVSSYLSHLLQVAISRRVSDIHLEPLEDSIQVRYRIDGLLVPFDKQEEACGPPLISRIKLLSGLDIGERRIPQDGGFTFPNNQTNVDIRVSTLPTIYGEKIVMRLLTRDPPYQNLTSLGLDDRQCHDLRKMLHTSQGMLLVTGPTGSGKTTTLYTLLGEIRRDERNVIALEDPVEYHVSGINQVQVNARSGLTFTAGLRATLRQDPDVIFVGEIRDKETAEIAIRAALSGHLVLSTLHTPDAASTMTRLIDMGIEPYLVTAALSGIVAQRLIRRLCECQSVKEEKCPKCHSTGYFGRQAIFEVLPVHEDLHRFIVGRASPSEIRTYLRTKGFHSLNTKLREIVNQGLTTITEFQRMFIADVE
jgi:type II secretory ATPase GspE/PulE/Tfp pilus assembly ATPase PilB-like protein